MSKITNKIYLGNWFDAQNINFLKRNKISHILCCAGELRPVFPDHFEYKHIRANDHPAFNLLLYLESAANFIHNALETGTGIFVHCYAGVSRSTTCLVAYLMKHRGMTLSAAINYCRKKRSIVNPNPGFVHQLRNYGKKLAREKYLQNGVEGADIFNVNGESQNDVRGSKFGEFRSGVQSVLEKKIDRLQGLNLNQRGSKSLAPARPKSRIRPEREEKDGLLEGILTFNKIKAHNDITKEKRKRSASKNKRRSKTSSKGYRDVLKELRENDGKKSTQVNNKGGAFSEKMKPKIRSGKGKNPLSRKENLALKLGFDPKILKRNMPLIANPLKPTMNYYFGNKDNSSYNMNTSELYKRYKMLNNDYGDFGMGVYGKKSRGKSRGLKELSKGRKSATKGAFYNRGKIGAAGKSGLYNTHFLN